MASALVVPLMAGTASTADGDRQAIESVVRSAYVEGVHIKGDPALMRKGFPDGWKIVGKIFQSHS